MEGENGEKKAEGSMQGYESLHRLLESNLKPELFKVLSPSFFPLLHHYFQLSFLLPFVVVNR
jgi:hypothetical protein